MVAFRVVGTSEEPGAGLGGAGRMEGWGLGVAAAFESEDVVVTHGLMLLCVWRAVFLIGGFEGFLLRWVRYCGGSAEGEWKLAMKEWAG